MGGEGNFQLARFFFFCPLLVQEYFFQTNIAFLSVKSRFIIYFAFNKFFYTHNRSKDTDHFLIMCARARGADFQVGGLTHKREPTRGVRGHAPPGKFEILFF